jgi:hypothetical protein
MGKCDSSHEKGWRSSPTRLLIGVVAWSLAAGAVSEVIADSTLKQDFRLWAPVYLTVPLSSSFIGYMDVTPRFGDNVSNLDQLYLRPAIGYKLTDRVSLWQGYAWVGNYQPSFFVENRLFQQLLYVEKFPFVKLTSRSRMEERFIEHTDGTAFRARTMLRGDFPLPRIPDTAFVVYDEIFANLNTVGNGPEAGFDQNRFFLGLNHKFMKQFNMDLGYQMQAHNYSSSGLINQINNILLLQFFIDL